MCYTRHLTHSAQRTVPDFAARQAPDAATTASTAAFCDARMTAATDASASPAAAWQLPPRYDFSLKTPATLDWMRAMLETKEVMHKIFMSMLCSGDGRYTRSTPMFLDAILSRLEQCWLLSGDHIRVLLSDECFVPHVEHTAMVASTADAYMATYAARAKAAGVDAAVNFSRLRFDFEAAALGDGASAAWAAHSTRIAASEHGVTENVIATLSKAADETARAAEASAAARARIAAEDPDADVASGTLPKSIDGLVRTPKAFSVSVRYFMLYMQVRLLRAGRAPPRFDPLDLPPHLARIEGAAVRDVHTWPLLQSTSLLLSIASAWRRTRVTPGTIALVDALVYHLADLVCTPDLSRKELWNDASMCSAEGVSLSWMSFAAALLQPLLRDIVCMQRVGGTDNPCSGMDTGLTEPPQKGSVELSSDGVLVAAAAAQHTIPLLAHDTFTGMLLPAAVPVQALSFLAAVITREELGPELQKYVQANIVHETMLPGAVEILWHAAASTHADISPDFNRIIVAARGRLPCDHALDVASYVQLDLVVGSYEIARRGIARLLNDTEDTARRRVAALDALLKYILDQHIERGHWHATRDNIYGILVESDAYAAVHEFMMSPTATRAFIVRAGGLHWVVFRGARTTPISDPVVAFCAWFWITARVCGGRIISCDMGDSEPGATADQAADMAHMAAAVARVKNARAKKVDIMHVFKDLLRLLTAAEHDVLAKSSASEREVAARAAAETAIREKRLFSEDELLDRPRTRGT